MSPLWCPRPRIQGALLCCTCRTGQTRLGTGNHAACMQTESGGGAAAESDADAAPALPHRPKAQLAAASRTMLNQFVDELRAEEKVDLSGKNLMDEGVAFVAEGLAYNQTCKSARFSSNAMAAAACFQLAEVLRVCPCRFLPVTLTPPCPPLGAPLRSMSSVSAGGGPGCLRGMAVSNGMPAVQRSALRYRMLAV